jgi:hypothetical protein
MDSKIFKYNFHIVRKICNKFFVANFGKDQKVIYKRYLGGQTIEGG